MISPSSQAAVFLLFGVSHGFKAFEPTCTAPSDDVTWVSPPSIRGTMDVIFSCFSVLLICTWAIQHLSVPPHKEPHEYSWNRRFVKSQTYSAFLDDARFNFSKLKWMAMSLLAPEYILSKALSEFLAARDAKRQFNHSAWTTTHGYFANMRGFILCFDVEAVETPQEPSKPTAHERSFFRLWPNGDAPYYPQDPVKAEMEELKHCHQYCQHDRPHHEMSVTANEEGSGQESRQSSRGPATMENRPSETYELLKVDVESHPNVPLLKAATMPVISRELPHRTSEDFATLTPITLVDRTEASQNTTPSSLKNRHGFPLNQTPTGVVSDYHFPSPTNETSPAQTFDYDSHPPESPRPPISPAKTQVQTLPTHTKWSATWPMNSLQMLYAYREGIIALPTTSAEELNDRSKGDALVKGLAVLHILWLVIQTLARGVEHLAITQLEITVLGFSSCAVVTYFLLWHKPQDVKVPTYIEVGRTLTREHVIGLAARSPVATLMIKQYWLHGVAIRAMADNVFPWTPGIRFRVPYFMKKSTYLNPHLIGIGGGGAIFGGIHLAAWNFEFPTGVERMLWRVSATYLVVIPLIGITIYCLLQHFNKEEDTDVTDGKIYTIFKFIGRVGIPLYLLARLYLMVEVFRCLAYPPQSVFEDVTWPSIIPHIS